MKQYLDLLQHVLRKGGYKEDRTGVGTLSTFGEKMEFDLSYAFPAVTTKKLFFRGVKEELLWMLRGETNIFPLQARGVHIWDEWADENGDLGPVYGAQWRDWDRPAPPPLSNSVDQIREIVMGLRDRPDSRRHILSAWNVADLDIMQLAPCHILAQFYVRDGAFLDCQLYQRSGDLFLGVPFNIASYALLTHMIAHVTGYEVGAFYHVLGDAHIYTNHMEQVKTQLGRDPLPGPSLWLNPEVSDIDQFDSDDIALEGYQHHPKIEAPVAV